VLLESPASATRRWTRSPTTQLTCLAKLCAHPRQPGWLRCYPVGRRPCGIQGSTRLAQRPQQHSEDGAVRSSGNSPPRSVLAATGVRPNFPSWAGDVQSFDEIGTRCGRPKGLKVGVANAMNAGGTSLNFEMFDRDAVATHHARKRMRYWARRRAG
jgi:hypothetical protein